MIETGKLRYHHAQHRRTGITSSTALEHPRNREATEFNMGTAALPVGTENPKHAFQKHAPHACTSRIDYINYPEPEPFGVACHRVRGFKKMGITTECRAVRKNSESVGLLLRR